jgi:molybdate transport system substrate-binding protein
MWSCPVTKPIAALFAAVGLLACGGNPCGDGCSSPAELTVYAAASLQPAFDKIAARLHARSITTTFNYAGTQTLTAQLIEGAQADVFASADTQHMTTVQSAGLLTAVPKIFAHNRLEIAVEHGNPKGIRGLSDLARPDLVVVLADPAVPAGKYAQQALAMAGVSVHPASLEPQVTGVLSKVALGEADAGIVYVSDIVSSGKVDGVEIPDRQNVVAEYPIAVLKNGQHAGAGVAFMDFVLSSEGQAILVGAGFERA